MSILESNSHAWTSSKIQNQWSVSTSPSGSFYGEFGAILSRRRISEWGVCEALTGKAMAVRRPRALHFAPAGAPSPGAGREPLREPRAPEGALSPGLTPCGEGSAATAAPRRPR